MAVTVDSLELKITHDSADAVKGINALVRALRRLKTAAGMGADLKEVADGIRALKNAAAKSTPNGLAKAMKNVKAAAQDAKKAVEETNASLTMKDVSANAHKGLGKIANHWDDIVKKSRKGVAVWESMQNVAKAAERGFTESGGASVDNYDKGWDLYNGGGRSGVAQDKGYWDGWEDHMNSFKSASQLAADARQAAREATLAEKERQQAIDDRHKHEDYVARQAIAEAKAEAKEKAAAAKEAVRVAKEETREKLRLERENARAIAAQEKEKVRAAKEASKERREEEIRTQKFLSSSLSGFSRISNMIGRTLLRRVILGAIRAVSDGFQEGLENLYHYSELMNSLDSAQAKSSLDAISTSLLYMKNSIGAAVAPLIQSLVPVLQTVVNWAVSAANAINMFISALQGKTTYTKAKESAVDMFDGIKTSASGAGKAAKEALATLLGFDEINRLDAPNKGGGGGGGGASSSSPDYGSMFDEALIELPQWLQWIKDNMDKILPTALSIGGAILAWEVSRALISGISNLVSMFSEMSRLEKGLSGLILVALGMQFSWGAGFNIGRGTADLFDYIKGALGVIAAGIGGALIGSSIAPGVGTAVGFAIGITLALVANVVGTFMGSKQRLIDMFYESDIGKSLKAHRERAETIIEEVAQLKLDIDSITGEVDAKTMGKLERAQKLINEIFDLDEKDNKTAKEMVVLQEKVKELNGLEIDGLQVEFDVTSGKVKGTREEVQKLFDKVKEEIKLEAAREALKQVWQKEFELKLDVAAAQDELNGALSDQKRLEGELAPLKDAVRKAEEKKLALEEKYKDLLPQVRDGMEDYAQAVTDVFQAKDALKRKEHELQPAMESAAKDVDKCREAYDDANKTYEEAAKKTEMLEGLVYDLASANSEAQKSFSITGEKSLEYSKDVTDSYKDIQLAAQDAVNAVGGINDIKMTSVHNQLQTINNDLNNIAKKRTVSFSYPTNVKGATGYYSQMYASGGYPQSGDLFWAGEAGPELVGTVNGRTAVASNQEITGITNAVYAMGEREVAAIENLTRALNAKNMTAVITADSIVSGLARKNRRDGVSTVPVSV